MDQTVMASNTSARAAKVRKPVAAASMKRMVGLQYQEAPGLGMWRLLQCSATLSHAFALAANARASWREMVVGLNALSRSAPGLSAPFARGGWADGSEDDNLEHQRKGCQGQQSAGRSFDDTHGWVSDAGSVRHGGYEYYCASTQYCYAPSQLQQTQSLRCRTLLNH
jgi:hypothetical protein